MDHRETPRDRADDRRTEAIEPLDGPRKPLAQLPSFGPRRPTDRRRLVVAAVAILIALSGGFLLGRHATRLAIAWIEDQRPYQVPFQEIRLEPPRPLWYRRGSGEFLEEVRRAAMERPTIPVLKLKETELKLSIERSPWVEEVEKITYEPLGIRVRLKYRRPVALVRVSPSEQYLLDESARILPLPDVDLEQLRKGRKLIGIRGMGLTTPENPEPGALWKTRPGGNDLVVGNRPIPAAAKLACFLVNKLQSVGPSRYPALDLQWINPMDQFGRGLFIETATSTFILWGDAPGEEQPESLSADEKWSRLCEWSRSKTPRTLPAGNYWRIDREGLRPDGPDFSRGTAGGTARPAIHRRFVR